MSPSDCFEWSRRDSAFDVRDEVNEAEREEACAEPVSGRMRLGAEWAAGDESNVARWAPGCPVRMSIGGVGGGRILGLTPEPAQWSIWEVMVDGHRNVRGLWSEYMDEYSRAVGRLGQCTKPPFAGRQHACFLVVERKGDCAAFAHVVVRSEIEVSARRLFGGARMGRAYTQIR